MFLFSLYIILKVICLVTVECVRENTAMVVVFLLSITNICLN